MAYPRKMIPPISQSFEEAMQIIAKGTDEELSDDTELYRTVKQKQEEAQKNVDNENTLDYTD